jgi:hypothetical protein
MGKSFEKTESTNGLDASCIMSMFGHYNAGRGYIRRREMSPREIRRAEAQRVRRALKRAKK